VLAAHPPEPHVYIYVLGVHPDRKGTGLGGALLRYACGLADAGNVETHLETSNPINVPMYQHFGFEVREEIVLPGVPPVWVMRRPAAGST
jgi:ribosomal protein S18 acetylase RimI-like enzyme